MRIWTNISCKAWISSLLVIFSIRAGAQTLQESADLASKALSSGDTAKAEQIWIAAKTKAATEQMGYIEVQLGQLYLASGRFEKAKQSFVSAQSLYLQDSM